MGVWLMVTGMFMAQLCQEQQLHSCSRSFELARTALQDLHIDT